MMDLVFVMEEGNCLNHHLNYFPVPLELVEVVDQALAGNPDVRYMECCCRLLAVGCVVDAVGTRLRILELVEDVAVVGVYLAVVREVGMMIGENLNERCWPCEQSCRLFHRDGCCCPEITVISPLLFIFWETAKHTFGSCSFQSYTNNKSMTLHFSSI
jgi:hypothetical protein